MKIFLIVAGSLLVGVLVGVGTTAARFELAGGEGPPVPAQEPGLKMPPPDGPQPKVEVDHENYDYGVMERGGTQSHAFVFTNVGDYPLQLMQGDTTCKCTISKLDASAVPPGESVEVTLEWTAKTIGNRFRQSAVILTNDPARPRVNLTVEGKVSQSLVVEPQELIFSKARVGESKTAEARLIAITEGDLKVLGHKFTNAETADHFALSVEPLPESEARDHSGKTGLLLTVTLAPGLPVGAISQELELTTNAAESPVTLSIRGRVVSDISVFGRGWNAERGVLALGAIDGDEGVKKELAVFIRGERPERIALEVAGVEPDVLRVRFGEKQVLKAGELVKVPLVVEVPPGTPPINCLGGAQGEMGEILIHTNHPQADKLRLLVHFAVE